MARLKHLYAYGYDAYSIGAILREEFQDIEVNDVTGPLIVKLIRENKEMLDDYKLTFAEECTAIQKQESMALYNKAAKKDSKIAETLLNKMDDILAQICVLDLADIDPKTRAENYSTYNGLLAVLEKTQLLYGKIAGTEQFREVALHRMKAEINAQFKPGGNGSGALLPAAPKQDGQGASMPEFTG